MTMGLTLDQALGVDDLPITEVPIAEWGGSVYVRTLRADEKAEIEEMFGGKGNVKGLPYTFRSELLMRTLVNEDKTPWVTPEQMPALMKKSGPAIEAIFDAALKANGFRESDVEAFEGN